MNKKIKIILCLVAIIVISAFSLYSIININNSYPSPTVIRHKLGDVIDGGVATVQVTDYKVISYDDLKKLVPNYTGEDSFADKENILYLFVNAKFTNKTSETQTLSIPAMMSAETEVWSNGLSMGLFSVINPKITGNPVNLMIKANESIDVVLPYSLFQNHFNKSDWKNVKNLNFDIPISLYPVKNIVQLHTSS